MNTELTQNMNTIQTSIETITPEIAKQYLETNYKHQRNITESHVLHLRQQMKAGQWMMTGVPIIFDQLGQLIDGQQRLTALIAEKMTLQFAIIRGVETDSFMAIDRGKPRSNANIFSIHGASNATTIASMVANVLNYRRARIANLGRGGSLNSYVRA